MYTGVDEILTGRTYIEQAIKWEEEQNKMRRNLAAFLFDLYRLI